MISGLRQKALLALAVGMTGALAILTRPVLELEETAGLDWMFLLRGSVEPPASVVIVSIDSESADELELPEDVDEWPRSEHAEVARRLRAAEAATLAFDIHFQEERTAADDQDFAAAIREFGKVLLLEWLDTLSAGSGPARVEFYERVLPLAVFADAAIGSAAFPLPSDRTEVNEVWLFGPDDPDAITLPAAAVHAFALDAHDTLLGLVEKVRPGSTSSIPRSADIPAQVKLTEASRQMRFLFRTDGALARDVARELEAERQAVRPGARPEQQRAHVDLLIELFGGDGLRRLNFYGVSRTISTVPYSRLLAMEPVAARDAFAGKIVFVGFSELQSQDQQDAFATVFSERTGTDLGGVEIGATAAANLIDGDRVRQLAGPFWAAIPLLWGMALVFALLRLPTRLGVLAVVSGGAVFIYAALRLFTAYGIWVPIVTPVFAQIPLALIAVFAWKYAHARREGEQTRRTLETYLPKRAIDELVRRAEGSHASSQLLHGTCLVTDAQNYTALAERLPPRELQEALNAYYSVLFPEVERRSGFVADVVGDSMVAIWATPEPDSAMRLNACRAALAIRQATRAFNSQHPAFELPTRIGVHSGQILLGDIGTDSHREYRAIGDIVNTASRIQVLNKQLRTALLVSEDVLDGAGPVSFRRLGEFKLAGKEMPIRLCDRLVFADTGDDHQPELISHFEEAHRHFVARRWREAAAAFEELLVRFPDDGPSEFFLRHCRRFAVEEPGSDWTGTIMAAAP
jgi:adenylate cyclase